MTEQEEDALYVTSRLYIETGALHYLYWVKNSAWPETEPTTEKMVAALEPVFGSQIPLTPEESAIVVAWDLEHPDQAGRLPPELRRGDVMFRHSIQLVALLNEMFPGAAGRIKAQAGEDTDGWGLEDWAVALAVAGGTLFAVGKIAAAGLAAIWAPAATLAVVAGLLLLGAAAGVGLNVKTKNGKTVIQNTLDGLKGAVDAVAQAGSRLMTGIIVAASVGAGVGVAVWLIRRSPRRSSGTETARRSP